jgi:hypothetical protein
MSFDCALRERLALEGKSHLTRLELVKKYYPNIYHKYMYETKNHGVDFATALIDSGVSLTNDEEYQKKYDKRIKQIKK